MACARRRPGAAGRGVRPVAFTADYIAGKRAGPARARAAPRSPFSMIALTQRPRIAVNAAAPRGGLTMLKKAKAAMKEGAAGEAKDLAQAVLDSSHQIWLAGVGAF